MNFLAHIYLSGDDELVKIGNFMADGIRGKEYESLHPDIRKGVLLHRFIDTFTDSHRIFRQSTKRLHEKYHHYSGVIVDVLYDHFLAKNWSSYCNEDLGNYVDRFYRSLEANRGLLNRKTLDMMPYMIGSNWLWNYQYLDGIERILYQMDQRTKNNSRMQYAIEDLKEHYGEFGAEFTAFFEEMRKNASEKLKTL